MNAGGTKPRLFALASILPNVSSSCLSASPISRLSTWALPRTSLRSEIVVFKLFSSEGKDIFSFPKRFTSVATRG